MPVDKALGVDGFLVKFFTGQWNTTKSDVLKVVKECFYSGKILKSFNCAAIALIPIFAIPIMEKDYRPISCYTTFYKLITKILTNRMKKAIGYIIGPSQSTFIEERSIIDNILFIHELFKWYSRKGFPPMCVKSKPHKRL